MTTELAKRKKYTQAEAERLERENRYMRETLQRHRQEPPECPFLACDSSCVCATPRGLHTNGGCRCDEATLRRAVMWWRARAQYLQANIIEARDGKVEDHIEQDEAMRERLEQARAEREARR